MPRRRSFAVAINQKIKIESLPKKREPHKITENRVNASAVLGQIQAKKVINNRHLSNNSALTPQNLVCYKPVTTIRSGLMRCPKCGCQEDKVIDSRASREGATIRRRRECSKCSHRFTTYEEVEREGLMVLKRDGRHEEFTREKLLSGIKKACQKRPVSPQAMEDLVDHIVAAVTGKFEGEVPAEFIGTMVVDGLRDIDEVAYVRFASVYRRFQEATDFVHEVKKLEAKQ
jgi:transcriptional repressor NrdR